MTWPLLNVLLIRRAERGKADKVAGAPTLPGKSTSSWLGELLVRHLRLSTYLIVALLAYSFTWPMEAARRGLEPGWIGLVVMRNLLVQLAFVGGWHWFLYERNSDFLRSVKFNKADQYAPGTGNLRREQLFTVLGSLMSSAYEVAVLRLWATQSPWLRACYEDFWAFPGWSVLQLLLVAYWRDFHFFFCHRLMHPWRFKVLGRLDPGAVLYRHVHSLHHKSHNPGPWSGLSMHPAEHLLYFSCTLLNAVFVLHPVHFLYNKFHADLSPIAGHDGHDQPAGGSLFHYIHHAHFEYNYGTPMVPLDVLFGTYEDGSRWKEGKKE